MGQGIAQIAAQAGSLVKLYDVQAEAVAKASKNMHQQWDKLLEKNRFTAEQVTKFKANLHSASQLSDLNDCDLVIEAIDRKSTRLNSSHVKRSRMPSSA